MSSRKRERKFFSKNRLTVKKVNRKVNRLARRLKPEAKRFDFDVLALAPPVAGNVTRLAFIIQGIADNQRVGIVIKATFMEFRYTVLKHATPTTTEVRLIIVRDNRQVESVIPSVLDVLNTSIPISQYSRVNPKRFTILWNKIIVVRTNRIKMFGVKTRKLNFPLAWVGAAAADITKNGIFLIALSDQAANFPIVNFTWRLHFTDV